MDPDPDAKSGRIRIILPEPDRYKFQANDKVDKLYFLPRKFHYDIYNTKNYDTFDTDEKDNYCKLAMLCLKVTKNSHFQTCVKLMGGSALGCSDFDFFSHFEV